MFGKVTELLGGRDILEEIPHCGQTALTSFSVLSPCPLPSLFLSCCGENCDQPASFTCHALKGCCHATVLRIQHWTKQNAPPFLLLSGISLHAPGTLQACSHAIDLVLPIHRYQEYFSYPHCIASWFLYTSAGFAPTCIKEKPYPYPGPFLSWLAVFFTIWQDTHWITRLFYLHLSRRRKHHEEWASRSWALSQIVWITVENRGKNGLLDPVLHVR